MNIKYTIPAKWKNVGVTANNWLVADNDIRGDDWQTLRIVLPISEDGEWKVKAIVDGVVTLVNDT